MSDGPLHDQNLPARQLTRRTNTSSRSQPSGSTNAALSDQPTNRRSATSKATDAQKPSESKRRASFSAATKTPKNAKGSVNTPAQPRPHSTLSKRKPRTSLKRPLRDLSGSDSESSLSSLDSSHSKPKAKARQSGVLSATEVPTLSESCSHAVGSYVWVLLDRRGRVFRQKRGKSGSDDEFDDMNGSRMERIWWPAKVVGMSKKNSLKLKLFSSPTPSLTDVEVDNPTNYNVLSLFDTEHQLRFKHPTFVESDINVGGSPRKRQKLDRTELERLWKAGYAILLDDMEQADGLSDELPEVGLAFSSIPSSSLRPGPTSSQVSTSTAEKDGIQPFTGSEDGYSSPIEIHLSLHHTPDETLTIPGELILAREPGSPLYWPAKILNCVPPQKGGHLKYHILYLDTTKAEVPRDWFYSSDEPGFATCKLGNWQSHFDDVTVDRDVRDVDMDYRPSPTPMDPTPVCENFVALDLREQFVYTKPVLVAILNGRYPPALKRHGAFIAGGDRRQQLTKEAGLRGLMDPRHVEQLGKYLCEWCLRDARKAQVMREVSVDNEEDDGPSESLVLASTIEDILVCPPVDAPSPTTTELVSYSSSPDLPPASSFGPDYLSRTESYDSVGSLGPTGGSPVNDDATEPPLTQLRLDTTNLAPKNFDDAYSDLSDLTPLDLEPEIELIPRPPRQTGGPDFEALTASEKLKYCADVLLPEAVIQILLWRSGNRKSLELLSDEEEQAMHDKGSELVKETDWVHDVMRLRDSCKRVLEAKQSKGGKHGRARPRRIANVPNYQEPDSD